MKFVKHICAASLLTASLCMLWGCNDDDGNRLSDAVLASASTLNFEAQRAPEQIITIYADADWETEVPDWVTVTPDSGSGVMDVTISVRDNMRDGAEDNPRKEALVFKGRTLASRAEVLIIQNGDKYRDVKDYTPGEIAALADETVISVPSAIVVAVTTKGFIISDGQNTDNIFVSNDTAVAVGDKISLMGTKSSDAQQLATIIDCDEVKILSSGEVTYPAPKDITATIDDYNSSKREYITVKGIFSGSTIAVSDAANSVSIVDPPSSLGLSALTGHIVTITGYFAGLAEPVQRIMATGIEDNGLAEIVYFLEDFEWLDPWAEIGGAGSTVEANNPDATAPQLPTPKVDGVSALAALEAKGYEFLRVTTKTEGECIYLQRNYLKFGKTSYQAGIILPSMDNIPSGAEPRLSFDWCPMRQGSGKIDPVDLIIIVENDGKETTFEVPTHGWENDHKLEWIRAEIPLTGVAITKDTKITIRQTQWPAATANRWFLDNIKISEPIKL